MNGKITAEFLIKIFDTKLNLVRDLFVNKGKMTKDFETDMKEPPRVYLSSEDKIYSSPVSENEYSITVEDIVGKKVEVITKRSVKIGLTKEELEKIGKENPNNKKKFKNLVRDIKFADSRYLWVRPRVKGGSELYNFDIFKDGIYQNRVELDIKNSSFVKFINDRIIATDSEDNMVRVYSYEYVE